MYDYSGIIDFINNISTGYLFAIDFINKKTKSNIQLLVLLLVINLI